MVQVSREGSDSQTPTPGSKLAVCGAELGLSAMLQYKYSFQEDSIRPKSLVLDRMINYKQVQVVTYYITSDPILLATLGQSLHSTDVDASVNHPSLHPQKPECHLYTYTIYLVLCSQNHC